MNPNDKNIYETKINKWNLHLKDKMDKEKYSSSINPQIINKLKIVFLLG